MIAQATPLYANIWYPMAGGDQIDDSVWQVIGWTGDDIPDRPIIVRLGGHNGRPVCFSYPVAGDEHGATLDYADSLTDAQNMIMSYPPERRR